MKKTSVYFKLAAGLFTLALITAAFVTGTMSRYTASAGMKAEARVAKFQAVWEATGTGNPGNKRGLFLHPKIKNGVDENVTKVYTITWKCTNNSEVAVLGNIMPKHAVAPNVTANGANSIGVYANNPSSPVDLTSARITVKGGTGNTNFGGGATVTAPSPASQTVGVSAAVNFSYTIKGYSSLPERPANYMTPTDTADNALRGLTGTFAGCFPGSAVPYITITVPSTTNIPSIAMAVAGGTNVYPWFRTYRANTNATITQID